MNGEQGPAAPRTIDMVDLVAIVQVDGTEQYSAVTMRADDYMNTLHHGWTRTQLRDQIVREHGHGTIIAWEARPWTLDLDQCRTEDGVWDSHEFDGTQCIRCGEEGGDES